MPVKIVKINSETLPAIADAIRAKTGSTGSILPSQMAGKIANIPTGGELPVLSSPAGVGHVVAGKEYIDASGNKQTGTMVICDSVNIVETVGEAGIGVHAKIESTVDKSSDILTLQDPNFKPENIKSGISIFNVAGSVKEIRIETGTITLAEDTITLTIPCAANPMAIIVRATDAARADILGGTKSALLESVCMNHGIKVGDIGSETQKIYSLISAFKQSPGKLLVGTGDATIGDTVTVGVASQTFQWIAGAEYQWTAYYWEENQ